MEKGHERGLRLEMQGLWLIVSLAYTLNLSWCLESRYVETGLPCFVLFLTSRVEQSVLRPNRYVEPRSHTLETSVLSRITLLNLHPLIIARGTSGKRYP